MSSSMSSMDEDMPFCSDRVWFVMLGHHFFQQHSQADDYDEQFIIMVWIVIVAMQEELLRFSETTRRTFDRPECMVSSYVTHEQWRESGVFRKKMRMTYGSFIALCDALQPEIGDSICGLTGRVLRTRQFKIGVGIWYMAYGGTWGQCADAAGIGTSTAKLYTEQFCNAVIALLKPTYMPTKPDPERLARNKLKFTERRGISGIAFTVDGTHVPWIPDDVSCREDYHNYKGWYSLSCLMFVDAFYLFVDGDIGHPGRAGDSSIAEYSWLMEQIRENRDAWLGEGGFVIGDGGFGNFDFLMAPFANASTNREVYFNYCFSSSRFYVEQCFGWWKNRFRCLLRPTQVTHKVACMIIYASMIVHNFLTINDSTEWQQLLLKCDEEGRDLELTMWFQSKEQVFCEECRDANPQVLYCVHTDRIIEMDRRLAHSNNAQHSRGAGCDSKGARARRRFDSERTEMLRDMVADDLWREFMARHPDFDGNLSEMYLQRDK